MRERPGGAALLRLARRALLEDLIPALPERQRYAARLIAKALAIAAREQDAGDGPLIAEYRSLAELYDERDEPHDGGAESLEDALTRLNWRLAAEIRSGRRDAAPEIYARLCATTVAQLRETDPKTLERAQAIGREAPDPDRQ